MSWLEEYILICCGEERMIEMRRAKERKEYRSTCYGGSPGYPASVVIDNVDDDFTLKMSNCIGFK